MIPVVQHTTHGLARDPQKFETIFQCSLYHCFFMSAALDDVDDPKYYVFAMHNFRRVPRWPNDGIEAEDLGGEDFSRVSEYNRRAKDSTQGAR